MDCPIPILYQDPRILVCLKPPGVVSTDQPGGLPDRLRAQLGGGPELCLRTVHRLDQRVGGVMVLARSRMAARLLSQQVEEHTFYKEYLAVLWGAPGEEEGLLRDWLGYDKRTRRAYTAPASGPAVREAVLRYRVLAREGGYALAAVVLETGRTHQIRAQFAARGFPLAGDQKYGAPPLEAPGIGLWSRCLAFTHPQSGERLTFSALPPEAAPWDRFSFLKGISQGKEHPFDFPFSL